MYAYAPQEEDHYEYVTDEETEEEEEEEDSGDSPSSNEITRVPRQIPDENYRGWIRETHYHLGFSLLFPRLLRRLLDQIGHGNYTVLYTGERCTHPDYPEEWRVWASISAPVPHGGWQDFDHHYAPAP